MTCSWVNHVLNCMDLLHQPKLLMGAFSCGWHRQCTRCLVLSAQSTLCCSTFSINPIHIFESPIQRRVIANTQSFTGQFAAGQTPLALLSWRVSSGRRGLTCKIACNSASPTERIQGYCAPGRTPVLHVKPRIRYPVDWHHPPGTTYIPFTLVQSVEHLS
jgi:hypothetical protein